MTNFHLNEPIGESRYFRWKEALWLHEWQLYAIPPHPDHVQAIENVAIKMDIIRELLNAPITITSWYRPLSYNQQIGGAKRSSHMFGMACDFIVQDVKADEVRAVLFSHLEELNIRMENLPSASWVHIDTNVRKDMTHNERYFLP